MQCSARLGIALCKEVQDGSHAGQTGKSSTTDPRLGPAGRRHRQFKNEDLTSLGGRSKKSITQSFNMHSLIG